AARTVCVSAALRSALGAADDPRHVVIRNGIPLPPPRAAPPNPRAPWISVGRLHEQKGHDGVIRAWRPLGAGAPHLQTPGGGPLEPRLREEAVGLPVDLLGPRSDVPALLAAAGGFVLASRDEGLPLAVLEAMAAGLPVVATRVGGVPE